MSFYLLIYQMQSIIDIIIKYFFQILIFIDNIGISIDDFMVTSKFWFPFFLSLLSAFIFWLIFSFLPIYQRKGQLRPIIEYDFYCLSYRLLFLFETVLGDQHFFQTDIRSGRLTKKNFYIGLQNKCLNQSDLYDKNVLEHYEVIGLKLVEAFENIENIIGKILVYNKFSSPSELLILEQIRQKLKEYEITEKHVISHEGAMCVVSNLYYLYQNMYELYEFYKSIQKIVYNNNYLDRSVLLNNIQYLYDIGRYKKCKNYIKKHLSTFKNEIVFLSYYDLMCDVKLKKINYNKVEEVLKRRDYDGSLVSMRSFIEVLMQVPKINDLIQKYYSETEIKYCTDTLKKEQEKKDLYIQTNIKISEYMGEKDVRLKKINWD